MMDENNKKKSGSIIYTYSVHCECHQKCILCIKMCLYIYIYKFGTFLFKSGTFLEKNLVHLSKDFWQPWSSVCNRQSDGQVMRLQPLRI